VFVHGELWLARSASGNLIPAKTKVTIVGSQDHLLLVA
jgi:membrane-bound ClpP family serine protease